MLLYPATPLSPGLQALHRVEVGQFSVCSFGGYVQSYVTT